MKENDDPRAVRPDDDIGSYVFRNGRIDHEALRELSRLAQERRERQEDSRELTELLIDYYAPKIASTKRS
jgi:hypothetical protein